MNNYDGDTDGNAPGDGTEGHQYRWNESEEPSRALVEAVAETTDRSQTTLPPLQETVDADALDALLRGASGPVTLSFEYAGVTVIVASGGRLEIVEAGTE